MCPDHAVPIYASDDTIFVEAEGETLRFPTNEPARLVAWLRQRWLNSQKPNRTLIGPHFTMENEEKEKKWREACRVKGALIRVEQEDRKKREAEKAAKHKRGLIRRADQAKLAKEAEEFFREFKL